MTELRRARAAASSIITQQVVVTALAVPSADCGRDV
jgi:hypothetical protein